ncbi:MAG: hypothetical protein EXS32_07625 [Opitutus sp.]|nr:hypothetical protein [Opitutus sp.]
MRTPLLAAVLFAAGLVSRAADTLPEGVRRVSVLNYSECFELSNAETRVTLGHQVGGRVLEYVWRDKNALWLDPAEAKWSAGAGLKTQPSAGRFDIGPEQIIPRREVLWSGEWQAEAIGPRAVRLTSQRDSATGVQLVRVFRLEAQGTHLSCEQIIRNVSTEMKHWAHWSRTFGVQGGIGVVPLTPDTRRFPNGWIMYATGPEPAIQFRPVDPNVRQRGAFLEVLGPPRFPKLGFDSNAGWFAYVMPHGQAFVKRYASPRDAVYPEVAGLTLCLWYPQPSPLPVCELEPHGPRNNIPPGGSVSYTEHWYLLPHPFPAAGQQLDLEKLAAQVDHEAK